ncbi:serpin, partial [Loa loa]
ASLSQFRIHFYKQLASIAVARNDNYTLNIASRLYVREGFHTKDSFQRVLRYYHYNETLHKFNLEQKDELIQQINGWISSKTNNKIRNIITRDTIDGDTRILLLNAIYFKGTWESQFMKMATAQREFHISENEKKLVPMMIKMDEVPYYGDDSVQVIKLPYIGNEVEMVFILPKTRFGLANVLKFLTGEKLFKYIRDAQLQSVSISLPKFRVEEKWDLTSALKEIGITDAFSNTANFAELVNDTLPISLTKLCMQDSLRFVDEKGTESAAATTVELSFRTLPSYRFVADQPFLFAIVKDLKTILFAGQFVN